LESETPTYEEIANLTLRVDYVIPLRLAIMSGAAEDQLREFIDQDLMDAKQVLEACPKLRKINDMMGIEDEDIDLALEAIEDEKIDGVLIRVSRPIMDYWPNGSASFSWGAYNTATLYGKSMDSALAAAVAWANELDAKQREKGKEKAK
jgi:hypothetical protein